jgi:hypothetical protein
MSRTRRALPTGFFRYPRGHRQARAIGARAVPPHAWDDLTIAGMKEALTPVSRLMHASVGRAWAQVRHRIQQRHGQACAAWAETMVRPPWRGPRCHGQLFIDDADILRRWQRG